MQIRFQTGRANHDQAVHNSKSQTALNDSLQAHLLTNLQELGKLCALLGEQQY